MKTAWFLGHRVRECMKEVRGFAANPLGGVGKTLEAEVVPLVWTAQRRC